MATISTQLRNFKEPTKDHLLHLFFSIPEPETSPKNGDKHGVPETEKMEINSVLSLGEHGIEDSYVSLVAAILLSEIKQCSRV
jgi:TBC1 domain family member 8/9